MHCTHCDLTTRHGWPVKKAIVDLPISLKGNYKHTSVNSLSPLGHTTPQACGFELISCINKGCMYVCVRPRTRMAALLRRRLAAVSLHLRGRLNVMRF